MIVFGRELSNCLRFGICMRMRVCFFRLLSSSSASSVYSDTQITWFDLGRFVWRVVEWSQEMNDHETPHDLTRRFVVVVVVVIIAARWRLKIPPCNNKCAAHIFGSGVNDEQNVAQCCDCFHLLNWTLPQQGGIVRIVFMDGNIMLCFCVSGDKRVYHTWLCVFRVCVQLIIHGIRSYRKVDTMIR